MLLLFGVLKTSAQLAMPDTVCVGATKHYSVNDPSVPSTYTWAIDGVVQSATTNEIVITWSSPGHYVLTVQEHSSGGCDGEIRAGDVYVFPPKFVSRDTLVCSNAIPFVWNGITVNAAGDYPYTTTSSLGCDSTTTLHVTVNPVVTSSTDTTVCTSALPFTWNGQTVNAAGPYTVTLTSAAGCDSIATLNVTVNPVVTSSTDTTVCTSALPFTWNGQTVNAAGPYTVTLTSAAGCDSIATLNVTVNPVVTSSTDTTVCTSALPFTWNGQTVNAAGPYTVTLTSAAGCDSIATLNVTVNPVVTSSTDTTVCPSALPFTWNGQTVNAAGPYTVTLTSAAGCDSIATLNVTVNPVVTSSTDTTVCTSALPFTWNGQTVNAAGPYTVTLTSAAGCDSIATLNVTVNPVVTSSTDTTVCTSALPFTWNGQTVNAAGPYTVTLTSAAGCDSIATLNVTVNPVVTSSTDTTVCTSALPFTWNGQTVNAAGPYTVTLTSAAGCDSIATLNVTVNPVVTSSTDTTVCTSALPFTWNGQTVNAAGPYTVTLTSAAGCDSIATLNVTVNPVVTSSTDTTVCTSALPFTWNGQTVNAAGPYTVTLTSAAGCDSIATLNVTVNSVVTSSTDTTVCTSALPFTWNGQTVNAAGPYTVTLTSAAGCDSIATLNVTVNPVVTSSTDTTVCTSALPFTWNGQTVNAAGPYTVTLTSAAGCDSIATLNVTVNPVVTSSTDTTVCTSALPFTWNGQTVNAAGPYTVTLTSAAGCDSIATLNVTVNPVVTSSTDTTVCTSALPFTWNGQTVNAAGPYTVTLTSAAGCDSIATLNVTVNPVVTSSTDTTVCTSALPFTWNGQTVNAAGPYTVTLTSAAGCDSIATLNVTVNPVVTSSTDTTVCTSALPFTWNGQTVNAAGPYTVTLTSAAGCDSIATLNVTVNPVVTSSTDTTVCTSALPFTWNGQTVNAAGPYTVTLTSAAGCDSIATLNVTVNPVVTSSTDTTVCTSALPFTWNGQTVNAAGPYTVTLTSAAGCDSIATLNVTVNPVVTSSTDTTVCTSALPFTWNGQTVNAAGPYTVTLTSAAGCDSIATLNVTVNPVVTSSTDTTVCTSALPFTWNGQTVNAAGPYTVTLTSAAGCDSIATLNVTVNPVVTSSTDTTVCTSALPFTWNGQTVNAAGPYTVTLTSAAGCDSIATLNVTVNPVVTSSTDTTVCTSALPFTWNGQTVNAAGPYTVTLTSAAGCDSIATLNVTVNPVVTSSTDTTVCTSALPFTWNGQTVNAAGPYTVTLTSAAGCDSIATLNVTVNPVVTSSTDTTVCTSALPFTWNGQTVNAAGPYTVTLTSAAGCDSIATLNVTVNPVVTSSTDTTVCTSALPFTWNGQTVNAAGPYTVTLTSAAGCDSIATLNVTVNPVVTSSTDTTVCTSALPFTWNGQTVNAAGPYTVTLTSAAGCDSIATLNVTVNPVVTSSTDTTVCTSALPFTWNGQTVNAAGPYTVTLTSAAGCDSIATLNVTVNPVVTSSTDTTVCTSALPFTWNGQTVNAAGPYTVTLTSAAGCDSIATLNVTVNPVVTSSTDTTVCTSALPFTWNGQTVNAAGPYTVTLTSAAGCDSIATLNVTVNPVVTSSTDTTVCTSALPFTWNGQTVNAAGPYTVTLTSAAGCDSIATLNVTVNPVVTSSTDTTVCTSALPFTWNGQTVNAAGPYTVTLTSAAGCDSIATLNVTVNPVVTSSTDTTVCTSALPFTWNGQTVNAAGPYTVTLTSAAGCDSIATLNVTVNSVVTSSTDTTVCTSALPFTWNGQTVNAAGPYTVTLTSAAGCDSIATLNVTVNPVVTSSTDTTVCTSALPFTWNGQTVNAAGPYTVTLTSAAGCDSIATLNVTVNPVVTSSTDTTVCTSALPFTWNGQTVNAAGPYTVTLTSAAGCDSIATLNVTVNPVVTSSTDTTVCTSALPFTWNGQIVNAAGPYTVTLTSAAGCDSIATLNVTVNPVVTSSTDTTVCTSALPFTWNGQTVNAAGPYTSDPDQCSRM